MASNEFVLINGVPVEIPVEVVSAEDSIAARKAWYADQIAKAEKPAPKRKADPKEE